MNITKPKISILRYFFLFLCTLFSFQVQAFSFNDFNFETNIFYSHVFTGGSYVAEDTSYHSTGTSSQGAIYGIKTQVSYSRFAIGLGFSSLLFNFDGTAYSGTADTVFIKWRVIANLYLELASLMTNVRSSKNDGMKLDDASEITVTWRIKDKFDVGASWIHEFKANSFTGSSMRVTVNDLVMLNFSYKIF
jgi:hypothetical protein